MRRMRRMRRRRIMVMKLKLEMELKLKKKCPKRRGAGEGGRAIYMYTTLDVALRGNAFVHHLPCLLCNQRLL